MAASGVRPVTVRGGRESSRRAWSTAPIERSGSMIRATGRPRNESSPSRVRGHAAGRRACPRRQSQARAGVAAVERVARAVGARRRPARPPDSRRSGRPRATRSTVAPSARTMPAVERTSAPSPAAVMRLSPSASAASSSARWLIDLSPGRRSSPRRRVGRADDARRADPVPDDGRRRSMLGQPAAAARRPRRRRCGPPWRPRTCSWTGTMAAIRSRELARASSCCSASDSAVVGVAGGPRP